MMEQALKVLCNILSFSLVALMLAIIWVFEENVNLTQTLHKCLVTNVILLGAIILARLAYYDKNY